MIHVLEPSPHSSAVKQEKKRNSRGYTLQRHSTQLSIMPDADAGWWSTHGKTGLLFMLIPLPHRGSLLLIPFLAHEHAYIVTEFLCCLLSCSCDSNAPLSTSLSPADREGKWGNFSPLQSYFVNKSHETNSVHSPPFPASTPCISVDGVNRTRNNAQVNFRAKPAWTLFWGICGGKVTALCIITAAGYREMEYLPPVPLHLTNMFFIQFIYFGFPESGFCTQNPLTAKSGLDWRESLSRWS